MANREYTITIDGSSKPHCRCSREELIAVLRDLQYNPGTVLRTLRQRGRVELFDDLSKVVVTTKAVRS
jgi:hypothetical protein